LIEVRYDRGLYLPELDLWLDPSGAKPRAFVSHAHGDHFARHAALLCSAVTGTLIQRRFKLPAERLEAVPFHLPVVRDGFRLRLLPAGHIAGSAMLHVTRLKDQATLLYTGDFKVRRSRTAEPIGFLTADTLITETTFGLPAYVFPTPLEVESALLRFVHDAFADGETPVLCGYSLGKAQELIAVLAEHGIPTLQHPSVAAMTAACREAGVALPEPVECIGSALPGQAVVAPPSVIGAAWLRGLRHPRIAMATGWALQAAERYRRRVAELIPLSDHADHPGLLECIQRVRPRRVLTVHGFAREFAAELRSRGLDAWCAMGHDQLELAIATPPGRRGGGSLRHVRAICPLADFSDVCRLTGETSSCVAKLKFVADYLRTLENDHDLTLAVRWLGGGALAPRQPGAPPLKLTAATLRRVLLAVPGVRPERCHECFTATRNPARAARAVLQEIPLRPEPLDLPGVETFLLMLAHTTAPLERISTIAARLATLHPAEAETLLKLLLGQPVADLPPDTLEAAVAAAFATAPALVRRSCLLTGELAETALLARHGRLQDAVIRPLVPVCHPSPTTTSPGNAGPGGPADPPLAPQLAPKLEGDEIRAQLHKLGREIVLFDPAGHPLNHHFPALIVAAAELRGDFIIDGLIIGPATESGAVDDDLFSRAAPQAPPPPPRFIALDLLWQNGTSLLDHPPQARHHHLQSLWGQSPLIHIFPDSNPAQPAERRKNLS
jgi:DNA ligase-1